MQLNNMPHEAMLAAIIDSSEDAIISKDLNGNITSWNISAERIFGYTRDEIIGKHISLLIPSENLHEEEMIISNIRAGKRIEHYHTIRKRKDGRLIHISLTVSPIKGQRGDIIGASKIVRDITAQKEAEAFIQKHIRQLERLNETGKSISAQLDVETILQKVTDATTELSGAAFGAFFYNTTDDKGEAYMLYALSGAPKEAFAKFGMPRNTEVFAMTFSGEGVLRSEDITKDPRYGKNAPHKGMPEGHLPVVSYLAVPVVSQAGIVIGGLFFGHHQPGMFKEEHEKLVVTIAAQAAAALENARLYEEVQALNERKDEFIGFASHELKTPLTTISGYLQMVEQTPGIIEDFLPRLKKQVNRLSGIISDLLDVAKIQSGKMDLNFVRTELGAFIKENVESVRQSSNRQIECMLPAEEIYVMIDSQKMGQVLVNVISNAVKYSEPITKVEVSAVVLGDEIHLRVQDWGRGIASQYLDKIFSRFYRIMKPGKNDTEGLGIGLYISRKITEAHGGKIWAQSEEGKGTTIHIHFPVNTLRK